MASKAVARSVGKAHGLAVDRFDPRPRSDSPFRHQCQIILRLGQAGGEDVVVWLRRTKLLRAAAALQHHLFHSRRDRLRRQHSSGLRGKTGESNVIRRHAGKELLQHIALATHGDGDLRARCRQFACDFERADRTAGNEHGLPAIGLGPLILGAMDGAAAAGKTTQPGNGGHVGCRAAARRDHDARKEFRYGALAASRADDPAFPGTRSNPSTRVDSRRWGARPAFSA